MTSTRDALELYRQVFKDNRAIKLVVEPESGAIVDANEAASQFYGYSTEELCSMNIAQINALSSDLGDARTTRNQRRFRFPHRLASGEIRRVEVFSNPITLGDRTLEFSIINDITERERAQEAVVRSEARFRTLVEELPTGVVVHREGRVVYANAAAAGMLGWPAPEFIGTRVLEHVRPDAHAVARTHLVDVEQQEQPLPFRRLCMQRRDRTPIEVEVRGVPIEFDGQPAVVGLLVDTSERDLLESQLTRAQRMEAMCRLAGGVAHDFNNLLLVILNVAKLLSRKLGPDDPQREYFDHIDSAARRASDLTRQLLLFARGAEITATATDLDAVVAGLAPLLRGSLGSQIALVIHRAGAPAFAKMARIHLEQVLINLAVNARDAMPDGGKLVVETSIAHVREVRIVVRDTGVGMPEDVAAHAFEPFFTTKDPGRGTGLGLAITASIIHKVGGTIELQSAPGLGTTFTIILPAAPAPGRGAAAPAPSVGRAETIVVVDDEAHIRTALVSLLEEHGFRAIAAADATEAERLVAELPAVDLLLTDVLMPRVSGPELVARLRVPRPDLRVLYMSGYAGDALPVQEQVVMKPFDDRDLMARIRAALDEDPVRSAQLRIAARPSSREITGE